MHYGEGTIEIFGLFIGAGFAVAMLVGATLMSRMLARDDEEARAREGAGKVVRLQPRSQMDQGRRAA